MLAAFVRPMWGLRRAGRRDLFSRLALSDFRRAQGNHRHRFVFLLWRPRAGKGNAACDCRGGSNQREKMNILDVLTVLCVINVAVLGLLPLCRWWVMRMESRLTRIETMLTESKNGKET